MKAPSSSSTMIRFKNSKANRIAGAAMVGILVSGEVVILLHIAEVTIAIGVFAILLVPIVIAIVILVMILMSDIVVDSKGMHRRVLGHNFGGISWTQVVVVHVISRWNSVANSRGRGITFCRVPPKSNPWYRRLLEIKFMDNDIQNPREVISVLNEHIAAHGIEIEQVSVEGSSKGSRVPLTQL